MAAYSKFITAAIGAIVAGLGAFGVVIPESIMDPALQSSIVSVITAVLVYLVPNRS